MRGIRPTFAILEFGTCDLANGTDALSVADAVMNVAHRIIDDFGVRHVTVCSVLHRTYPHHINADIDTYNNVLRHFSMFKPISITTRIEDFGRLPMIHGSETAFIQTL